MGLISNLILIYELIIIARVIMSWISTDKNHPISRFIIQATEPVLEPIRKVIPANQIGLDLSPLIVLLLLQGIRYILR